MMVLSLVDEAVRAGARHHKACEVVGLPARTLQRWRTLGPGGGEDGRRGPSRTPHNKLCEDERQKILDVANSADMRDLSPRQIVPQLADRGQYVASESTMYRVLEAAEQKTHRGPVRARANRKPAPRIATGPAQLLCWDITYLPAAVRGTFFYLYVFLDVWSRKIVGWEVHERESDDLAAPLFQATCKHLGVDSRGIVLHSDNGAAMKGATMLAMMTSLGVTASFSRPAVSDDNPFIESLFRTLKYRPDHPMRRFATLEEARVSIAAFVRWYNHVHLHSSIGFVTPHARHVGADLPILAHRRAVYEAARAKHPERWTGNIRDWKRPNVVNLNPDRVAIELGGKTIAAA
jgi:putative transposase